MKYKIDLLKRPIYLQIYQQIRDDIVNGTYCYQKKLPSKRLLADEIGVSTITVEHAYALLCEEGYIESHERSGFFVIFRSKDGFIASSPSPTSNILKQTNVPTRPDFPFSVLSKTMRSILTDYNESILEKSPNIGCHELRDALRYYLARNRGIEVTSEQIVIGSGAEYLYRLIVELLGKNRIYGIEKPSYQKIEQVYRALKARYELLPLKSDGIDSSALNLTHANVLHTTPYRSFPTGITASASKRHEYLRWADHSERMIIEDDFESEFSISKKSEDTLFSLSTRDNIIYLNTFSQTISPSMRVGYMVIPQRLVPVFQKNLGFYSCTVPTFEQLVIAELLNNGSFERHVNRIRRKKRKEVASQNKA